MDKTKILAVSLVICLIALSVIGVIYLKNQIYLDGVNDGSFNAVLYIAQLGAQCNEIPIKIGNETINLIAVKCLK